MMPAECAIVLSWTEDANGGSQYRVSATNNATGDTIIQKHGTTAPESVTSQDTKTQDTEDATQAPPQKPQDTAPQTPDESETDESESDDDVF